MALPVLYCKGPMSDLPMPAVASWAPLPYSPQVAPLVAGLQDRLRGLLVARQHAGVFNRHEDLGALRAEVLVAHGGFGSVYQGLWQGLEVAIKVRAWQWFDNEDMYASGICLCRRQGVPERRVAACYYSPPQPPPRKS